MTALSLTAQASRPPPFGATADDSVRVKTTATILGARIAIQADIGFGDAVTSGPVRVIRLSQIVAL